jgi:hypothetical protein
LLSLDAIHGTNCPVKFWYHHPAVAPETGTHLLQTPDGKLYYRVVVDGKLLSHGEAREGSRIGTPGPSRLSIVKQLPHARQKSDFLPVRASGDDPAAPESAVLVNVQAGGKATDVWLKRADPDYGIQQIATPQGTLGIAFGYERFPLGFSLKLVGLGHGANSPTGGDGTLASSVRVIDKDRGIDIPAEISPKQPLVYGGFTFSQYGHEATADGRQVSILAAAYDPGAFLRRLGGLLLCLGLFAMFYKRAFSYLVAITTGRRRATPSAKPPSRRPQPPSRSHA